MVKTIKEEYDVLILGAGMAGLTAGLYAARYNLKTAIISKVFGGTGNIAGIVENWPGFEGPGLELMQKVIDQSKKAGVNFIESNISQAKKDKKGFFIELDEKIIYGKSLIVALGMQHQKLNVKGEKEFLGKGVSYCATCDAMFFKNKVVAVVGGGNSAAKAAIYLSEIAKKVYLVHRRSEMRCDPTFFQQLKSKKNLDFVFDSIIEEIKGDKKVAKVVIKSVTDNPVLEIDVDGVFIEIGAVPFLDVVKPLELALDEKGFIITDKKGKTNVEGVFAAGDNTNTESKQLVVSAAEGSIAAKEAYDYLKFKN